MLAAWVVTIKGIPEALQGATNTWQWSISFHFIYFKILSDHQNDTGGKYNKSCRSHDGDTTV
jgi:hypothetical protein